MKKNKTVFLPGLTALLLAAFLIGCEQQVTTEDEDTPPSSQNNPVAPAELTSLPPYSGSFVSSKSEAGSLATLALETVSAAMTGLTPSPTTTNSLNLNGIRAAGYPVTPVTTEINGNGIKATFSYSTSEDGDISITFVGEIDKTWTDDNNISNKIKGKFNIEETLSSSETAMNISASYKDTAYTISSGGKGIKLVISGELNATVSIPEEEYSITKSTLCCTIYDNNNAKRYEIGLNDLQ
ncbi:MAG: hypothetical protein LBC27_00985 [Spirochaetaceae bacterium]|jgi:hypothetical protein|nr:hypothetical protein [Spirochaetaceae bacterium]